MTKQPTDTNFVRNNIAHFVLAGKSIARRMLILFSIVMVFLLLMTACNFYIEPMATPKPDSTTVTPITPTVSSSLIITASEPTEPNLVISSTEPLVIVGVGDEVYIIADAETIVALPPLTPTFPVLPSGGEVPFIAVPNPNVGYLGPTDEAFKKLGFTPVQIFYATDRKGTGSGADPTMYEYGSEWESDISYGTAIVTIPNTNHTLGEIELPFEFWFIRLTADPTKHVTLSTVTELTEEDFYSLVEERMGNKGEAFVFIHGFNTTFESAALRTGQLTYDLDFEGAPIFYSWASQGTIPGYPRDLQTIERSTPFIQDLLADMTALPNSQRVHIIAHSLGAKGLAFALRELADDLDEAQLEKFNQIILGAADISADVFRQQIVPAILELGEQFTLYVSSSDKALMASEVVNGDPRLGDAGENIVIIPGLYTVDASDLDVDFYNHGYPFSSVALWDIDAMWDLGLLPDQRMGLVPMDSESGKYWRFRPGE